MFGWSTERRTEISLKKVWRSSSERRFFLWIVLTARVSPVMR